ncbi:MAG TPA: hypothetical protein VN685_01555 [Rhizomicrobium sp.]|nr:hypothetical protein [Rhizomicrobium sp.]
MIPAQERAFVLRTSQIFGAEFRQAQKIFLMRGKAAIAGGDLDQSGAPEFDLAHDIRAGGGRVARSMNRCLNLQALERQTFRLLISQGLAAFFAGIRTGRRKNGKTYEPKDKAGIPTRPVRKLNQGLPP